MIQSSSLCRCSHELVVHHHLPAVEVVSAERPVAVAQKAADAVVVVVVVAAAAAGPLPGVG